MEITISHSLNHDSAFIQIRSSRLGVKQIELIILHGFKHSLPERILTTSF
ncbi:protein of unknown function [Shewanella benthica]|uniref:Uncharacterized protein n=1 Tax=Shewanella benthica TaxID=43661 RepID=A0A330LXT6_9GAMM|nr:protein of unknown function [Shewanella benthica]